MLFLAEILRGFLRPNCQLPRPATLSFGWANPGATPQPPRRCKQTSPANLLGRRFRNFRVPLPRWSSDPYNCDIIYVCVILYIYIYIIYICVCVCLCICAYIIIYLSIHWLVKCLSTTKQLLLWGQGKNGHSWLHNPTGPRPKGLPWTTQVVNAIYSFIYSFIYLYCYFYIIYQNGVLTSEIMQ